MPPNAHRQAELLLDRLEIIDFRQYPRLNIERLGRVNLIVGKNGIGKTSLLEAIRILATIGAPHVLWEIASARDEQGQTLNANNWRHHGFANLIRRQASRPRFSISSSKRSLHAELAWYREVWEGEQFSRLERVASAADTESYEAAVTGNDPTSLRPMLEVRAEPYQRRVQLGRRYLRPAPDLGGEYQCMYVGASGISVGDTGRLWDRVALTALEDDVIASLSMIYPGLVRISLSASEDERVRIPRVKLRGYDEPVPLRTLGDGVNRLFGIALALVSAKDGVLLIDEVENGIHYSVQPQLWQFLINAAEKFNVQLFATTHSTDTIQAFQWAAKADPQVDGLLTRVEDRNGRFTVTQFDEMDLGIAVTEAIEVR
jgi:ABC-type transport system involved in cytochrome c biogenesis ATPase subunit